MIDNAEFADLVSQVEELVDACVALCASSPRAFALAAVLRAKETKPRPPLKPPAPRAPARVCAGQSRLAL